MAAWRDVVIFGDVRWLRGEGVRVETENQRKACRAIYFDWGFAGRGVASQ
jgi:hypothetical protein